MMIDPVCGMTVDEATAHSAERDSQTFYFCSDHCRQKFLASGQKSEPKHHDHDALHRRNSTVRAATFARCARASRATSRETARNAAWPWNRSALSARREKVIYTCPMHPEIEQDGPGTCPKCGMALEPKTVQPGYEEDDTELRSMTRRFWVALVLTMPVLLLAMLPMIGVPVDRWLGSTLHSMAATCPQYAGGSVGRLAVLRAWLEVDRHLEPQHVHADRHRHGSGILLQPHRRAVSRHHSRQLSSITGPCRSISRRRR